MMILSLFNERKITKRLTPGMMADLAENASVFKTDIYKLYIFVIVVVFRHKIHQRVLLFCLCIGTDINLYSSMVHEKILKYADHTQLCYYENLCLVVKKIA